MDGSISLTTKKGHPFLRLVAGNNFGEQALIMKVC